MRNVRSVLLCICLLLCATAAAQRRVSADVQVKTLSAGKVSTVTKSVYCTNNGRLVTFFHKPLEYVAVTNPAGELRIWLPGTNELITPSAEGSEVSSKDELLSIFMSGRLDDLGLGGFGYKPSATVRTEEGYIKKTFTRGKETPGEALIQSVDIVYDKYLPIYCEYMSVSGKVMRRLYLSGYATEQRLTLPMRMTSIEYGQAQDSTIVRTIYSNVKIDQDDSGFDFEIPADAKPVAIPAPSLH